MPTTPILGLRTPVGGDALDVPTDMLELATDVEASLTAVQAFTASGTIQATGARTVTFAGAAGQTLTLPPSAVGQVFEILNLHATASVTVTRAGADLIGGVASVGIAPGGKLRLRCLAAGVWRPVWDVGEQVAGGYAQQTGDTPGAGDKLSFTVTGDGVTPMEVLAQITAELSATASQQAYAAIMDGAGGAGTRFARDLLEVEGGSAVEAVLKPRGVIPPFSGTKTLYLHLNASSGTVNAMDGSRAVVRFLRARWAPGYYTANPT